MVATLRLTCPGAGGPATHSLVARAKARISDSLTGGVVVAYKLGH